MRPAFAAAIARINACGKPVVALDLPSGVDPESGGFLLEEPVQADLTTCFVGSKVAILTGRARNVAGEIATSTLDIPEAVYERVEGLPVLPTRDEERQLPDRAPSSHKRHFGHVLIIGGNAGMGGAALLAGEACLRTGAGLVSVSTHVVHAWGFLTRRPELMVHGSKDGNVDAALLANVDVVAVGPGLGRDAWAQRALRCALECGKPLVIDADALNLLAQEPSKIPVSSILTPHPGEAARLLNSGITEIENDRMAAICDLTEKTQTVAVLKGAGSLVASNGKLHGLCDVAEPALSTAGSGDVLTGVIAAVLAQCGDPLRATALGVHLHARAGQRAQVLSPGYGVIAGDLIEALQPWG